MNQNEYSNKLKQYWHQRILNADRYELMLLLFEACLHHIKSAKQDMLNKKIASKCEHIQKAYDIVLELYSSLNHEIGGDLSKQLAELYDWVMRSLVEANIHNKSELLDSCAKVMGNIYDGFKQAVAKIKEEKKKNHKEAS